MYLYLQIGSLLYVLVIAIIYFRKKSINTIENIAFNGILICSILSLIIDIISTQYNIVYGGGQYGELLYKLFLFTLVIFTILYSFYVYCISSKIDAGPVEFSDHPQKKKITQMFWMLAIITIIICIVISTSSLTITIDTFKKSYYQVGQAMYITYGVTIIAMISWIFIILKDKNNLKNKKYNPIYAFFTIGIGAIVLQFLYPDLAIVSSVLAAIAILTFFTMENPDVVLIQKLIEARTKAEEVNQIKTQFLSNMSHEIRTPLNVIVGYSQALAKEDIYGNAREDAQDIIKASNSLLEIVNGVLDISRIESNKIEVVNSEYNTKEMFNEVINLINTRIGSKSIELKVLVDENLPPILYGDNVWIKLVITNLLINAIKYTNEGCIVFQVNAENDYSNSDCKLTISVQDTGIVMTEESIEKLFTKLQILDFKKNIKLDEADMDVAIIKSLVELMNGEMKVKSSYGEGATFTIILNQKIIKKENIIEKVLLSPVKAFDASGSKVLVVDDNKINLKVAERLLREYNITVETVLSGIESIDKILDGKKYDLIFMDIMMPKMNGVEALENLKNIVGFKTPVVALTVNEISGMEEKYISQGFDDCLAKPIIDGKLYHVLKKFLRETKEESKIKITSEKLKSDGVHNIELLKSNGINVEESLKLLKDKELYDITLEEFWNELQNKLLDLKKFKEEGCLDEYAILAHGLKSEAIYLGCNELGKIAYEHEIACKNNNLELVNEKFIELITEGNRVYEVIKKYLGE